MISIAKGVNLVIRKAPVAPPATTPKDARAVMLQSTFPFRRYMAADISETGRIIKIEVA